MLTTYTQTLNTSEELCSSPTHRVSEQVLIASSALTFCSWCMQLASSNDSQHPLAKTLLSPSSLGKESQASKGPRILENFFCMLI